MSPRPKRFRRMRHAPLFRGFIPVGREGSPLEPINLHFDEYEAIKLCDYDGLKQVEAAKLMDVSRPTFTRIYESARNKIAIAIAEIRPINIDGGRVQMKNQWFRCTKCNSVFNGNTNAEKQHCPLCNSMEIEEQGQKISKSGKHQDKNLENKPFTRKCFCPQCGNEIEHKPGVPCKDEVCRNCGGAMKKGKM